MKTDDYFPEQSVDLESDLPDLVETVVFLLGVDLIEDVTESLVETDLPIEEPPAIEPLDREV